MCILQIKDQIPLEIQIFIAKIEVAHHQHRVLQ